MVPLHIIPNLVICLFLIVVLFHIILLHEYVGVRAAHFFYIFSVFIWRIHVQFARGSFLARASNGKRIQSRWETANVVRIYVDVCARYGHRGFIGASDFFFRPVLSKKGSCSNNLSIKGLRHRRKLWNNPKSQCRNSALKSSAALGTSIYLDISSTHCINTTPQGKICSCNINSCTVVRNLY